jgi:protein O-mannosyl-transferase
MVHRRDAHILTVADAVDAVASHRPIVRLRALEQFFNGDLQIIRKKFIFRSGTKGTDAENGVKVNDGAELRFNKPEEVLMTQASHSVKRIAGFLQFSKVPGWLSGLLLIVLVMIVYHPLWHAGFIWDDDTFLLNNPLIKQSDGLYQFWFSTKAPDYFPLTSTTLWLEWRLWGENPLGYHIVNVLLHAVSTVLIWRVLAHLKIPGAWLAAALFAVHPVNVESVVWITERKNTLAMLFYITSIFFYLRFEDLDRRLWYEMALGFFVLALLSKTAVAPLPIVLLGLAWWQRGRISRRDVFYTLPFFGVAMILGLITIWFQSHNAIGSEVVRADNMWSRLAGAGWVVWFYLYKALIPVHLMFVYPKWQIDAAKLLSYVPGLLVLAGALVFWYFREGWGKAWLLGLGYFIVMLLPVLGFRDIYFMRYSLVADHWQYFAIIGPIGLAAAGITCAFDRLRKRNIFLIPVFSAILVLTLGVLTWRQTLNYSDVETLWKTTIAGNPACLIAHNNLGLILEEKGQFDEAMSHYQEVIRLNPNDAVGYINRGNIYYKIGQYQMAIEDYNKAIGLKHDYTKAYIDRAIVYLRHGNKKLGCDDALKACELGNCKIIEKARANKYCR